MGEEGRFCKHCVAVALSIGPARTTPPSAQSVRSGDGQVTITYDPATDSCPEPPTTTPVVPVGPRFAG